MTSPTVEGTAVWTPTRSGGVWRIKVACPYCGDIHMHGGGSDPERYDGDGHRAADCSVEGSAEGYVVESVIGGRR